MQITEFVRKFKNHPVLFVGTGLSLRYIKNSYSWEALLEKIASEIDSNREYFIDLKRRVNDDDGAYDFPELGAILTEKFEEFLAKDRNGKFQNISDKLYNLNDEHPNITRLQIYISELLKNPSFRKSSTQEIEELRKAKKNISSVITTNYDQLIEKVLDFKPLVGNDILLSNPYGAVYKIHGCVTQPDKIIITTKDYKKFKERYELIRAQLISLFIHNPIIFIGYGIGDENIIEILRTIFKYVDSRSEKAKQIQSNFLIVEYERGSTSTEVNDFGIDLGNNEIIQVNKIKTDNFVAIYQALSDLSLPISVMDIRRVETIVRKITEGSEIKVAVADDIDQLDNSEKILYIGTEYKPINAKNLIKSYFRIIETKEEIGLKLIEDNTVKPNENFPIFGFSSIYNNIKPREKLEKQQILKITDHIKYFSNFLRKNPEICLYSTPKSVYEDSTLPKTYKHLAIIVSTLSGSMDLDTLEKYLKTNINNLTDTGFRQILCAYDLKRFGSIDTKTLLPDDIEIPKT